MSKMDSGSSDGSHANLSFEQAQQELEAIVHDLEEGRIDLAQALARYEQGVKLLQHCYAILQRVEQKIELLAGVDADGRPITTPFDDEATADRDPDSAARGQGRGRATAPAKSRRPSPPVGLDVDGTPGLL
jgi:exodeoxyribonuclease VII small subunit